MSASSGNRGRRIWPLVRLSVGRPVAVFMLLLGILAMGLVTYFKLPIQLLPAEGFTGQSITVWVPYPNASPRECEEGIVKPVEEALGAVPGIREIHARASADGASVRAVFNSKADLNLAQADLKEQIERVKIQFPEGVDRYFLYKFDMNEAFPVLFAGILISEKAENVHRLIQEIVTPRLERLEGVAQVQVLGLPPRQVLVEVDRDAVSSLGVPLYGLIDRLRQENRSLSCGDVEDGGRRYLVRALGKLETFEEIEEFPVQAGIRLRDVGGVRIDEQERDFITRVNRMPAVILFASKESSANTVDVCGRLADEIDALGEDPRLAGLLFHTYFNQGDFIAESMGSLKQTALYGGMLAVVVLLLFLKAIATTVTVALAIPLSMLIALVLIYFTGGTLNMLSTMGLTLGIGMMVDNSIVVAENIDRLRKEGTPIRLASLLGPSQVGLAIVMSTLTTVVVFVPLIFLGDNTNTRVMMKEIGFPVIYSLGASLFVALVFVPLAMLLAARRAERARPARKGRFQALLAMFRRPWIQERTLPLYSRLLPLAVRFRLETVLYIVIPFLATTGIAFQWVKKTAELGGDSNRYRVEMEFPENVGLEDADLIVRDYEARVDGRQEELGIEFLAVQFDRNGGTLDLFLDSRTPPDLDALGEKLKKILPERAGVDLRYGTEEMSESEQGTLRIVLSGPDTGVLAGLAREVETRLDGVEGLETVKSELEDAAGEIRVGLEREMARRYQVDPSLVLGLVATSLRGAKLPDFETKEETLEVWVRFQKEDRASLDRLKSLRIPTPDGGSVTLDTLASFARGQGFKTIHREDRRTTLSVTATFATDDQEQVAVDVRRALAGVALPRGYRWEERGGFQEFEDTFRDILKAMGLAVVFVFLLMGILFESFVLPLSVMLSIPFAVFGGLWSLVVTRTPLDGVAMVGFILLAGVVVNNAIVLIDTVNRLRRDGRSRIDAILLGAKLRFRPIWMTALTTILSLMPMALRTQNAAEGISYLTMARSVIGGLLVSTLFTLFIVPLFYTLFDDLGSTIRRFAVAVVRRKRVEGTPAAG